MQMVRPCCFINDKAGVLRNARWMPGDTQPDPSSSSAHKAAFDSSNAQGMTQLLISNMKRIKNSVTNCSPDLSYFTTEKCF
jgi:hypothetical protein